MTFPDRPGPDHDDELLSAYLDDELGAQERRALEDRLVDDDGLARRLEELAGAIELVAAVPGPSGDEREAILSAVRSAVMEAGASPAVAAVLGARPAEVVAAPVPPTRRPSSLWSRRALWSLAAALLVVVGVAGLVRSTSDDSSGSEAASVAATSIAPTGGDDASSARIQSANEAADSAAGSSSGATGTTAAAAPSLSPPTAFGGAELGRHVDVPSVIDAARRLVTQSGPALAGTTTVPPACPNGTPQARATVGDRAVVVSGEASPAGEDIVVRDALTCVELGRAAR